MLEKNIKLCRQNISKLCQEIGVDPSEITLVAATKTVPPEVINKLPECGVFIAGENRTSELTEKFSVVKGLEWHFVGALQTNKAKHVVGFAALIQSVDRENLAKEIDRLSLKRGIISDILIEVNIGGESTKSGVSYQQVDSLVSYVYTLKNVRLLGFMSVLPKDADELLYIKMKQLYDNYKAKDSNIKYLSMGMSGDYLTAIKCGANMVRLGSILFGNREYK